jgi:hypothetical protein
MDPQEPHFVGPLVLIGGELDGPHPQLLDAPRVSTGFRRVGGLFSALGEHGGQ